MPLLDLCPKVDSIASEVISGLSQFPKTLPPKLFYDERGSRLFDEICQLDAYYPTRTESAIMETCVEQMVDRLGQGVLLVEYGSGSSLKTRILLDHLPAPAGYVPIDISKEHLLRTAQDLASTYDGLDVYPVCADYTTDFALPEIGAPAERVVVYFPGSTIGNFDPAEARSFLARVARRCSPDGGLLIGVDLKKDTRLLEAAYNDPEGVTAAFNRNVLRRINRELGADFDLKQFTHHAFYDTEQGRIEMHLISRVEQAVTVCDRHIHFNKGESIHTENSYKYSLSGFRALAREAGFDVEQVWTDPRDLFSVQYLTVL